MFNCTCIVEVLRQLESNGSVLLDAPAARAHLNDPLRCDSNLGYSSAWFFFTGYHI